MTQFNVPMANRVDGPFIAKVVAKSESQAAIRAMELNPTSTIIGRIFAE